jgi:hypothetical protein
MANVKASERDPRNRDAEEKVILLAKVQIERSLQARVRLNRQWVGSLYEVLEQGKDFKDKIEVYFDGTVYWLADGFHRAAAYEKKGWVKVKALVRQGTHRDAMIHAVGANDAHGLPRSRKDIQRAISLLLDDEQYARLSNRTLAKIVHCSDKTVGAVRENLGLGSDRRTYTTKHGTESTMNVSNLRGRSLAAAAPVNAFHDLPGPTQRRLLGLLGEIGKLSKSEYGFVRSWLAAQLPPTPKGALQLRTELEVEASGADEFARAMEEADEDAGEDEDAEERGGR